MQIILPYNSIFQENYWFCKNNIISNLYFSNEHCSLNQVFLNIPFSNNYNENLKIYNNLMVFENKLKKKFNFNFNFEFQKRLHPYLFKSTPIILSFDKASLNYKIINHPSYKNPN
jgi:hypothetical protein